MRGVLPQWKKCLGEIVSISPKQCKSGVTDVCGQTVQIRQDRCLCAHSKCVGSGNSVLHCKLIPTVCLEAQDVGEGHLWGCELDLWHAHALLYNALGPVRPLHSLKKLDPG